MTHLGRLGVLVFMAALVFMTTTAGATRATAQPGPRPGAGAVTFNKDVLPILQRNCQVCHRPGEIAPMSLLTYEDARPWARAMKTATAARRMPPWFADSAYGRFAHDRRLTDAEIATLGAWADSGAVQGDPKDKPARSRTRTSS